jgi:hypothetical protein
MEQTLFIALIIALVLVAAVGLYYWYQHYYVDKGTFVGGGGAPMPMAY